VKVGFKKLTGTSRRSQPVINALRNDHVATIKDAVAQGLNVDQVLQRERWERPATLLAFAAEANATRVVRFLIAAGADVGKGKHYPPLLAAVQNGGFETARALLGAGADPNVGTRFNGAPSPRTDRDSGWTPLMSAAVNGDVRLVKLLLKNGAKPNLQTQLGRSALSLAVEGHHHAVVRLLLKAGGRIAGASLLDACREGDARMVRLLCRARANVNAVAHSDRGELDHTPLEEVLSALTMGRRSATDKRRYFQTVRELLRAGARINQPTRWRSPLYIAAVGGDLEIVKLLLREGADPNQAVSQLHDERGRRALHAAALGGFVEIVRTLLVAGAEPATRDEKGRTALDLARGGEKPVEIVAAELSMHSGAKTQADFDALLAEWQERCTEVGHVLGG
jgi:ankyrin repeat protein